MSGAQWMVVLIVLTVVIGKLISRSMGHSGRRRERPARVNDGESERLREEVRALRERLAVLERIATDGSSSLERQIEALRDHRDAPPRARGEAERRGAAHYGQEQE